ncbi:MAG: SAM-dependent methyltransferase [Bacteriovoracaceae bacterium]
MVFKIKDHYYKKAKKENFLARSVYKLEEIDNKYKVIKPAMRALDLGYYPGSWSQYIQRKIGSKGILVGIDIQEVNSKIQMPNTKLFQKDIFSIEQLSDLDIDQPFDVVCSDMAPKTTGVKTVDQARSLEIVEKVFDVLPLFLKNGGDFVIKVFESQDAQDFFKEKRNLFKSIHYLRPKSTRTVSKEYFVIGKGFKA